jgi:hypothetical protein
VPNDEHQRKAALVAVGRRSGGARWRRLLATLR